MEQLPLSAELYLPASHTVQPEEEGVLNFPASQVAQAELPVVAAYLPAPHCSHETAASPLIFPAGQMEQ